jgi:hypothetical protein
MADAKFTVMSEATSATIDWGDGETEETIGCATISEPSRNGSAARINIRRTIRADMTSGNDAGWDDTVWDDASCDDEIISTKTRISIAIPNGTFEPAEL